VKTEWRKAPEFAEAAEAIGISTRDIFAMLPDEIAVFTKPDETDDPNPELWGVRLKRDADGILRMDTVPRTLGMAHDAFPFLG
jgi:hypothetical protein